MRSAEYTSTSTDTHSLPEPERRKRHVEPDIAKRRVIIWSFAAIAIVGIIIGFSFGYFSGGKHDVQEGDADSSESAATTSVDNNQTSSESEGLKSGGEDLDFGSDTSGGAQQQISSYDDDDVGSISLSALYEDDAGCISYGPDDDAKSSEESTTNDPTSSPTSMPMESFTEGTGGGNGASYDQSQSLLPSYDEGSQSSFVDDENIPPFEQSQSAENRRRRLRKRKVYRNRRMRRHGRN